MNGTIKGLTVLAAGAGLCLITGCMNLHKAAGNGDRAKTDQFLQKGVAINTPDAYGRTPLMWACGDVEMVRYLLDRGAEVNAQDANGETPLMKAAYVGKLDVVAQLVQAGADVNASSRNGWTPLMWAAGYLDVVEYLVEQGADIHVQDRHGSSPLQLAMMYGKPDVVKYLKGRGARHRPARRNLANSWRPAADQTRSAGGDSAPELAVNR